MSLGFTHIPSGKGEIMSKLMKKINNIHTVGDSVKIGNRGGMNIYIIMTDIMPPQYSVASCLFNKRSNRYEILVDDSFMELSETMKEFVVYHELGHIVHGHFELPVRRMGWQNIKRLLGLKSSLEIQADSYAFSKMECSKEIIKTFIRNLYEGRQITFAVAADIRNRCNAVDKL